MTGSAHPASPGAGSGHECDISAARRADILCGRWDYERSVRGVLGSSGKQFLWSSVG